MVALIMAITTLTSVIIIPICAALFGAFVLL